MGQCVRHSPSKSGDFNLHSLNSTNLPSGIFYVLPWLGRGIRLTICSVLHIELFRKKTIFEWFEAPPLCKKKLTFGGGGFALGRMVFPIPTFRDPLSVPYSKDREFKKPVRIHHCMLRHIPEDRRFQSFPSYWSHLCSDFRLWKSPFLSVSQNRDLESLTWILRQHWAVCWGHRYRKHLSSVDQEKILSNATSIFIAYWTWFETQVS